MLSEGAATCAALVERGDPDRFRAVMAAPVAAREVLFPVFAFNLEVARAPVVTAEPMIAQMRLQWWADVLEEIAGGGPVRRHEVADPLARVMDAAGARLLGEVVEARRCDVEREPFADAAALWDYLDATSGALLLAAAGRLGAADAAPVRRFGQAAGLASYLCAVPALTVMGRRPLPDEGEGEGEAAVAALARGGLEQLRQARAERGHVSPEAGAALLSGWQAGAVLRRAAKRPGLVAAGGLAPAPARARLTLAARALTGRW